MSKIIDFEAVMRDQMIVTSGRINPSTVKMLIDMGFRITKEQPIYDEAKERELFAEFSRRIVAHDAANFPIRWCDCVSDEEIEEHLNTWLACAQSRTKAGEVGDE